MRNLSSSFSICPHFSSSTYNSVGWLTTFSKRKMPCYTVRLGRFGHWCCEYVSLSCSFSSFLITLAVFSRLLLFNSFVSFNLLTRCVWTATGQQTNKPYALYHVCTQIVWFLSFMPAMLGHLFCFVVFSLCSWAGRIKQRKEWREEENENKLIAIVNNLENVD